MNSAHFQRGAVCGAERVQTSALLLSGIEICSDSSVSLQAGEQSWAARQTITGGAAGDVEFVRLKNSAQVSVRADILLMRWR